MDCNKLDKTVKNDNKLDRHIFRQCKLQWKEHLRGKVIDNNLTITFLDK